MKANDINRKILVIAYGYPPRAGSGIQRIVRITNLLPEFGWEPVVLTLPRWGNEIVDETWEKAVSPKVKIHRVFSFDPMRLQYTRKSKNASKVSTIGKCWSQGESGGLVNRLKSVYHSLMIPDRSILWVPPAVICGIFLALKYRPKVIFTTSGPFGVSLIGLFLSRLTGIPLIADYRDPWTDNPLRELKGFRRGVERTMEKVCINGAKGIIGVTASITDFFRKESKNFRKQKFITLTNGFDPADFKKIPSTAGDGIFRIVYTGLFYGKQTPQYLFEALKLSADVNEEFRERTKMIFAGNMQEEYLAALKKEPLAGMVDNLGYLTHGETLKVMARADALYLYIFKGGVNVYSSKLFEYLAARKYILASAPVDGIAADVINKFTAGMVVEPDDVIGLSQAMLECFGKFKLNNLRVNHSLGDLHEYSWNGIVEKIAEMSDQIVDQS